MSEANFIPRIQLALFNDNGEWSVQGDDLDENGQYDNQPYRITDYDDDTFASLNPKYCYEAWGIPFSRSEIKIESIGEVISEDVD